MSTQQLTTVGYLQVNALNKVDGSLGSLNNQLTSTILAVGVLNGSMAIMSSAITTSINGLYGYFNVLGQHLRMNTENLTRLRAVYDINTTSSKAMNASYLGIEKSLNAFTQSTNKISSSSSSKGIFGEATSIGGIFGILNKIAGRSASPISTDMNPMNKILAQIGQIFPSMGRAFHNIVPAVKGLGALGGGAMASLGPQMMLMAVVMQPIAALIEGILTPLEPLTEVFGAIGEAIGMVLVPTMNMIVPLITPFIPLIAQLATSLGPLIQLFFQFGTPIGLLLTFLPALMPIITVVISGITWLADLLNVALVPALTLVTAVITDVWTGFSNIGSIISNFFNSIQQGWENLTTMVSGAWENLGTQITGGGWDGKGWW